MTDEPEATAPNGPVHPADDAPELPDQHQHWRAPARFGSVPVEEYPIGWDRHRRFEKHYPRVDLPTQVVDRVTFGNTAAEPNRLIWGDNLHVMRQIESNSIDLIYMDPPFFSGRQYNVMWGDSNEVRSFNDIWESGMPGYLTWLNARLYEAKRLLKPTGSIYLHCDWHASHYIKVEMDKIFGYDNCRNQIIWKRRSDSHNLASRNLGRIHDVLLYYSMSYATRYNVQFAPYDETYINSHYNHQDAQGRYRLLPCTNESGGNRPYKFNGVVRAWRFSAKRMSELLDDGRLVQLTEGGVFYYKKYLTEARGVKLQDLWDDTPGARGKERIGYPTQKPEALLERIIRASSNIGDIVADVVMGGGTTCSVSQRLGRRFIGCDQSRVAVAVTAERLKAQVSSAEFGDAPPPDFTVEHWGIYEADKLSEMPPSNFRAFILHCFGATRHTDPGSDSPIHGWRNQRPIWVGRPELTAQADHNDVLQFANAVRRTVQYQQSNLRDATMLAWGFDDNSRTAADRLRQQGGIDLNFVRIDQVRIDHPKFREHIASRSTDRGDYTSFLTFVQPPVVQVGFRILGGRSVTFDAGDTYIVNSDAEVVNVQWDFNHSGRSFKATPGFSFNRDRNRKPTLTATHKFSRTGRFRVACKVRDSKGGEGTKVIDVQVE